MLKNKRGFLVLLIANILIILASNISELLTYYYCMSFGLAITIVVVTIILDIAIIAWQLLKETNTIKMRGSFNIFQTVDCEKIIKIIEKYLCNYKRKKDNKCECETEKSHVLMLSVGDCCDEELINIKQKIYQELSGKRFRKEYRIGNVHYPDNLSFEDLNLRIFDNISKKANVLIYDYKNANSIYINSIKERLDKNYENDNKKVKYTYIVYLDRFNHVEDKNNDENGKNDSDENSSNKSILDKCIEEINEILNESNTTNEIKTNYNTKAKISTKCNVIRLNNIITNEKNKWVTKVFLNDYEKKDYLGYVVLYLMETGLYVKAGKIINDNENNNIYYNYLLADCAHLLNHYQLSLKILNDILVPKNQGHELLNNVKSLKIHVLKHMGEFDESIKYYNEINNGDISIKRRMPAIYYLNYLMKSLDNYVIANKDNSDDYHSFITSLNEIDLDAYQSIYYAAYMFEKNYKIAFDIIDNSIETFERTNDRLKYNAYYIKAEMLRHMQKFNDAYHYYLLSSGILENHFDINLLDQNYFSMKYLEYNKLVIGNASNKVLEARNTHFDVFNRRINKDNDLDFEKCYKHYGIKMNESEHLEFNEMLIKYANNNFESYRIKEIIDKNIFIIL